MNGNVVYLGQVCQHGHPVFKATHYKFPNDHTVTFCSAGYIIEPCNCGCLKPGDWQSTAKLWAYEELVRTQGGTSYLTCPICKRSGARWMPTSKCRECELNACYQCIQIASIIQPCLRVGLCLPCIEKTKFQHTDPKTGLWHPEKIAFPARRVLIDA